MNTLGLMLLRCMFQVTLFAAATGGIYWLARRISPRAAATSLLSGLTLVLGLSLLAASPWPRWEFATATDSEGRSSPVAALSTTAPSDSPANDALASESAESAAGSSGVSTPTLADYAAAFWDVLARAPATEAPTETPWLGWLAAAALVGIFAAAARLIWGLYEVRRLIAQSVPIDAPKLFALAAHVRRQLQVQQAVELRQSTALETPATVGWRRPVVLFPRTWPDWSDDELRAALAHEMAHVAGRDFSAWILARVAVAIHFYNPLVRWLAARLQLEQELAADAAAAAAVGESGRYLRSLASLALATPPHRLSGPARTLIPSRSLLMRRVEMLRSPIRTLKNRLVAARLQWVVAGSLSLVAVVVAGLRPPAAALAQQQSQQGAQEGVVQFQAAQDDNAAAASIEAERIPVTLVPPHAIYASSIRPAEIFANKELQPLVAQINAAAPPFESGDVGVQDVAEVMMAVTVQESQYRIVVRMTTPQAAERLLTNLTQGLNMLESRRPTWQGGSKRITRLDPKTLVIEERGDKAADNAQPLLGPLPSWAEQWRERDDQQVVFAMDNAKLRATMSEFDRQKILAGGMPMQMIAPLFQHINTVIGGLRLDGEMRLRVVASTDGAEGAQRVAATLEALRTLAANMIGNQQQALADAPPEARPAIQEMQNIAVSFLRDAKIEASGEQVEVTYRGGQEMSSIAVSTGLLLPAIAKAREAARRTQSVNNLRQLALAIMMYENTHGRLPAARILEYQDPATGEMKRSQYPHSWRVALLPFLDQNAMYKSYRFDEPWDSEANKALLEKMPDVFHDPSDAGARTNASYFVLTGPTTVFPADKSVSLAEIEDGTSNTVSIVEARRDIPWTKPEDIAYVEGAALPHLGRNHPGFFLAAFADGHVQTISTDVDETAIRALITRNGGETTSVHLPAQPAPQGR